MLLIRRRRKRLDRGDGGHDQKARGRADQHPDGVVEDVDDVAGPV
jgi:hypothetical protein